MPPIINKDVSPPSVICARDTPCSLLCHATSRTPFNYTWTRNGQVPVGDNIMVMNNSLIVTPHNAQDYGVYMCHASNAFGFTAYKITLLESLKEDCSKCN